jgi:hypothetical protein
MPETDVLPPVPADPDAAPSDLPEAPEAPVLVPSAPDSPPAEESP